MPYDSLTGDNRRTVAIPIAAAAKALSRLSVISNSTTLKRLQLGVHT